MHTSDLACLTGVLQIIVCMLCKHTGVGLSKSLLPSSSTCRHTWSLTLECTPERRHYTQICLRSRTFLQSIAHMTVMWSVHRCHVSMARMTVMWSVRRCHVSGGAGQDWQVEVCEVWRHFSSSRILKLMGFTALHTDVLAVKSWDPSQQQDNLARQQVSQMLQSMNE